MDWAVEGMAGQSRMASLPCWSPGFGSVTQNLISTLKKAQLDLLQELLIANTLSALIQSFSD